MKAIIMLAIVLFLSMNLLAQKDDRVVVYNTPDKEHKETIIMNESNTPQVKIVDQYNSAGNKVEKILYKWDSYDGGWVANQKTEYKYNFGKQIATIIYTDWNISKKMWSDTSRRVQYVYDREGSLSVTKEEEIKNSTLLLTTK